MPKTRTMYMHTLDGKPATFDDSRGAYVYFVGGRNKVKLARSRRQIEREQRAALAEARQQPGQEPWTNVERYGYVLVEVPC